MDKMRNAARYRGVVEDERTSENCELNKVENKIIFTLYCPPFRDLRQRFKKVHVPDLNLIKTADEFS